MHRHKFHSRNAEILEITERGGVCECRVSPANLLWYLRMASREALHVGLIEHGIMKRGKRRPVVLPIEAGNGDHAFGYSRGVVALIGLQILVGFAKFIAEDGSVPIHGARQG